MQVVATTVDNFKGFQYIIPERLTSHQSPYAKVRYQGVSVAYILLKTEEVFYSNASNEVIENKIVIEQWISKNLNLCKKIWNQYNEVKI